jgi:photosynthetic reaction center H subunit
MIRGAIGHLDVAQLTLYAFFAFFTGLIWYLRQEDRREGYPLESEQDESFKPRGFLFIPSPKTFHLADGSTIKAPNFKPDERPLNAVKVEPWPGAPIEPTGDPLLAGVGPGSWNARPDFAYKTFDGLDVIAPMRVATNYAVAAEGGNPIGFAVIGADGKVGGTIKDIWVDRAESMVRYYEIATPDGKAVIAPVHFCDVKFKSRSVKITALTSSQFAKAPALKNPDAITMLEEEKVAAFFGGGTLYATPLRGEPLL